MRIQIISCSIIMGFMGICHPHLMYFSSQLCQMCPWLLMSWGTFSLHSVWCTVFLLLLKFWFDTTNMLLIMLVVSFPPTCPSAPVKVLLQQVQPLLHLSVGEVCVAVILPGWRLLTLGWILGTLAGLFTYPLVPVELWREKRVYTQMQGKWSVLLAKCLFL